MYTYKGSWYTLYFGDKETYIEPESIRGQVCQVPPGLPINSLVFQHQVHDVLGHAVTVDTRENYQKSLVHDGDYLITNIPGIAIGVLTADCLPIALADEKNKIVSMVHAGWRGAVGGIIPAVLEHMHKLYGTAPSNVTVRCGPCAHSCCYVVDHAFAQQVPDWAKPALVKREHEYYFDLLRCATLSCIDGGINSDRVDISASTCTICNDTFCSYRRNSGASARQMSIIWVNL